MTRIGVRRVDEYVALQKTDPATPPPHATEEEGVAKAIAALIPADVLTVHALALSFWTTTDDAGVTTITDERWLRIAFVICLVLTFALFAFGRGKFVFTRPEIGRAAIPVLAFVLWTAMLGTSALTPWLMTVGWAGAHTPLVFMAAVGAVLVLALNAALNPKSQ